jgi:hypothetical protein
MRFLWLTVSCDIFSGPSRSDKSRAFLRQEKIVRASELNSPHRLAHNCDVADDEAASPTWTSSGTRDVFNPAKFISFCGPKGHSKTSL